MIGSQYNKYPIPPAHYSALPFGCLFYGCKDEENEKKKERKVKIKWTKSKNKLKKKKINLYYSLTFQKKIEKLIFTPLWL